MRNVTIRQLQVFVEAADSLSLARVAERLHLTPSAVSFQIKRIESQTGFALFERIGKRVHLTEPGQVLLGYARHGAALAAGCRRGDDRAERRQRRPRPAWPGLHRQIHRAAHDRPVSRAMRRASASC